MNRRFLKGILVLLCAVSFLMVSFPVSAAETARDLTDSLSLTHSRNISLSKLTDRSYTSKIQMEVSDVLTLRAQEPIAALYLVFDRPPEPYTVVSGETVISCGTQSFLHETIYVPNPQTEISITLPASILCDVYAFSAGTLPAFVQDWNAPYDDCDLLLLPTHADDEHLFFGGIMPYYAGEQGKKVQVAYLTNHWGEPYRPHELLNGLWTVGIRAYPVISEFNDLYSMSLDHAKTLYDTDKMLAYQVELIRRFRPEVIVGHDVNGEYGHGVHQLNTYLLMQAVEMSADEQSYPASAQKYGTFDVPKTYLHLYKENELVMDIDEPLSAFSGKTAYEMAVEGFAQHRSQQQWFSVEKSGKYDCRKFGLYRTTVGLDSGIGDLFEHIDAPNETAQTAERVGDLTITRAQTQPNEDQPKSQDNQLLLIGLAVLIGVVLLCAAAVLCLRIRKRRIRR